MKTKYAIKNGEFILEYVGEVVSEKEFKNRMASRYQHDTHHYCLNLDGGLVIDGHRMGGDGEWSHATLVPTALTAPGSFYYVKVHLELDSG